MGHNTSHASVYFRRCGCSLYFFVISLPMDMDHFSSLQYAAQFGFSSFSLSRDMMQARSHSDFRPSTLIVGSQSTTDLLTQQGSFVRMASCWCSRCPSAEKGGPSSTFSPSASVGCFVFAYSPPPPLSHNLSFKTANFLRPTLHGFDPLWLHLLILLRRLKRILSSLPTFRSLLLKLIFLCPYLSGEQLPHYPIYQPESPPAATFSSSLSS